MSNRYDQNIFCLDSVDQGKGEAVQNVGSKTVRDRFSLLRILAKSVNRSGNFIEKRFS